MSETIVFVSPLAALDSRLEFLGDHVTRIWDDEWVDDVPEQVIPIFVERRPDVIVIGPGVGQAGVVEWIVALERHRPDIAVVLVADPDSDLLLSALRAGVADVIPPNVSQQELKAALDRAREVAARRSTGSATVPAVPRSTNRVISVVSPKGGTGKTMLATNLALELARRLEDENAVGLVDLDVQFGSAAGAMGILAEHTLGDAASAARAGLDATTLKVFLAHHPLGPYVLAAPLSLVESEEVEADHVKAVLHHFAELFTWTVVDTASGIGEHLLVALEHATDLLMVTTPDVSSVRSLRRWIEALDLVGMLSAERHLVVNSFDGRGGLSSDEIEAIVGMEVTRTVAPSRLVREAMDSGRPLSDGGDKDPVVKTVLEVVDLFVPRPEPTNGGGWLRKRGR